MNHIFPKAPAIAPKIWQQLFEASAELYKLAPWKRMTDEDLFGVEIPETKELYFICVMGNARQTFGICIYRGFEGLRFYQRLLQRVDDFDNPEFRLRQNSLLLEFTEKKYMQPEDLTAFASCDWKPSSTKAWPFIRSIRPGCPPWYIDESEAKGLITAIEVIPDMVNNIKADPDFIFGETGQTIPVYVKKPRGWKIEWMGPRKIGNREGFDPEAELVNFNELALKKVQQARLETVESVWEVAHFYLPSPVVANNRPFYPKMLAIIERGSGFAVGAEMISPETDPMKAMKDLILQKMAEYKYIPSAIVSDDFWLVLHLRILSEKLNIATTQDELQNMGEFVEAIFTKAEDDLA